MQDNERVEITMKLKRIFSIFLALCLFAGFVSSAFALSEGDARAVIGADLTDSQIGAVYKTFGITRGDVPELTVTHSEELTYLGDLVSPDVIGTKSISCVYLKIGAAGSGVNVTTSNISYITKEMYMNALVTAGIDDAQVVVTAPFSVSGTAALTGIFKAYEDLTGQKISEEVKLASTQELVITSDLADQIGNYDAVEIVNQLKLILDQTKNMTDDQVRAQIREIAQEYGVSITDGQVDQLLSLCRSLEGLDSAQLQQKVEEMQATVKKLADAQKSASNFVEGVKNFFNSIGSFFSGLFGGNKG